MFNMLVKRGVAFVLDAIILLLIFFGNFTIVMSSMAINPENPASMSSLLIMLALQLFYVGLYFIYIPLKWPGQTIGKKILKIKEVTKQEKI